MVMEKKVCSFMISDEYDDISGFQEELSLVRHNNRVGFINKTGEIVIPFDYYHKYYKDNKCVKILASPIFKNGFTAMLNQDGKFGFIDKTGAVVIPFEYEQACLFNDNGLAAARKDKWGFINKKGASVIPFEYDWVGYGNFKDGIITVKKEGNWYVINNIGEIILALDYDDFGPGIPIEFCEGLLPVSKNGKKGFIDIMGKEAIPIELEYGYIGGFSDGFAMVMTGESEPPKVRMSNGDNQTKIEEAHKNCRWGSINKKGEIVIPVEIEGVQPCFREGFAAIKKDGKRVYIDRSGKIVIDTDYDMIGNFYEGLAKVIKDNVFSFIDKTGTALITLEGFESVSDFKNGYASIKKDCKYGFIDKTGEIVIPAEYDSVTLFNEGISIAKKDGKWELIQIRE